MGPLQQVSIDVSAREALEDAVISCLGDSLKSDGAILIRLEGFQAAMDQLQEASRVFFSLPNEAKDAVYIGDSMCHRGYVPTTEKGAYADEGHTRRYESFDLGLELPLNDTHVAMGTPLMGPNNWPDLPGFRNTVYGCYEALSTTANRLLQGISCYLGLDEGFFHAVTRKPISQLRLLHYLKSPALAQEQNSAMGAHTDYEFFSLIEATSRGLQVCTHTSGWIDVQTPRATFIMLTGDMLETVSNGLFRSVLHRVRDTGQERFAFPYFCGADFDAVLRPVTSGISGARTARYPGLPVGDYLLDRFKRDFPYLTQRHQPPQRLNMPSAIDSDADGFSWFERRRLQAIGLNT